MTAPRWFWVIAGPNGAGKSTLAARDFGHLPIVNPDVEAQRLSPGRPGDAAVAGGRAAFGAVRRRLAGDKSFAVETTLAGRSHLRLILQARRAGWRIGLAYVGIDTPEAAMMRVLERYRRGGHAVPPVDIRRRYRRSLMHLPLAAGLADIAIVYENGSRVGPRRVLEIQAGSVTGVAPPSPAWLAEALAPTRLEIGAKVDAPDALD